jgi:Tol biopolymer transport system component
MSLRLYRLAQFGLMIGLALLLGWLIAGGDVFLYDSERFLPIIVVGALAAVALAYGAWVGRASADAHSQRDVAPADVPLSAGGEAQPQNDHFDRIVLAIVFGLSLTVTAVVAAANRVGAQITAVTPTEGQAIGALGAVTVTFAEPMDAESVQARFSITPPITGTFTWAGSTLTFHPLQPFAFGQAYEVRVASGALTRSGRALGQDRTWTVRARQPAVVYVGATRQQNQRIAELFVIGLEPGASPRPLTSTGGHVYDFAVSPDGESIVYSLINDRNGADLYLIDRDGGNPRMLAACGADLCSAPAWAPDSGRIAFSRELAGISPGSPNGPPRVWTISVNGGAAAPLYQDSQVLGYGPTWSPDGRRLAFVDGSNASIRLVDLQTGAEMIIPTNAGAVGAWSPDGRQMLFTNLNFAGDREPYTSVMRVNFDAQQIVPVLGADFNRADFSPPAWSPDGQAIIIGQRTADSGETKQIWRYRPDGSDPQPLTADGRFNFGGYRWSPWGDAILLQRFELGVPYARPEVVIWEAATGQIRRLAEGASLPQWLP